MCRALVHSSASPGSAHWSHSGRPSPPGGPVGNSMKVLPNPRLGFSRPKRQVLDSLKLKPWNQSHSTELEEKKSTACKEIPLGWSSKCKPERGSLSSLSARVMLSSGMGSIICFLPAKLAGLCRDGAGGRHTLVKGCAQRAKCGKSLSICGDCLLDSYPPPVPLFSGTQTESSFTPPGSLVVAGVGEGPF